MLKTRIMTAVVLAPLAFGLIFLVPAGAFSVIAALLLLAGSWEFRKLAAIDHGPAGWLLPAVQAVIFLLLAINWSGWTAEPTALFQAACLLWLALLLQLKFYRPGAGPDRAYRGRSFFSALVTLTGCWMALAWLRTEPSGEWWILVLLLIIWAADIGAYFTGRWFGQSKLAPNISPGKTRAGLYGGLVLAGIVPVAAVGLIPALDAPTPALVLLGIVTALASVGGDLFISMHKRTVGCKDTGKLFPGHGGVLDRLDSLMAGAPFFVLGKLLAGW